MAGEISLSRNAKFYVSTVDPVTTPLTATSNTPADTFAVNVLSGYSFSQSVGTEEISPDESGCDVCRTVEVFNTSLESAQVSIGTYIQPFDAGATADCVEKILWNALVSAKVGDGITADATKLTADFSASKVSKLLELWVYVVYGDTVFRINRAQVESAEISFDISQIAQMTWNLQGADIEVLSDADVAIIGAWTEGGDYFGIPANREYINAKLSGMTITGKAPYDVTPVNVALTGGSLTISNNLSYLVPEELSVVSKPAFANVGALGIIGTANAYLKDGTGFTGGLLKDMLANLNEVKNSFALVIKIGGCSGETPFVVLTMPTAQLTIPTIDAQDIISTEIGFSAQASAGCGTDALTAEYHPTMIATAAAAPAGGAPAPAGGTAAPAGGTTTP